MNPNTPLEAVVDGALEARVVAWVLGEASSFEAAELERLCSERPELRVFERRMRALNGWMKEEIRPKSASDAWKLPPAKRRAIEEVIGKAPMPPATVSLAMHKRRARSRALPWILAIAASVLLMVGLAGTWLSMGGKSSPMMAIHKIADRARGNAAADEASASELAGAPSDKVALRTDYPAELIEGTPKPILLPGINAPSTPPPSATSSRMAALEESMQRAKAPVAEVDAESASLALREETRDARKAASLPGGDGFGGGRSGAEWGGVAQNGAEAPQGAPPTGGVAGARSNHDSVAKDNTASLARRSRTNGRQQDEIATTETESLDLLSRKMQRAAEESNKDLADGSVARHRTPSAPLPAPMQPAAGPTSGVVADAPAKAKDSKGLGAETHEKSRQAGERSDPFVDRGALEGRLAKGIAPGQAPAGGMGNGMAPTTKSSLGNAVERDEAKKAEKSEDLKQELAETPALAAKPASEPAVVAGFADRIEAQDADAFAAAEPEWIENPEVPAIEEPYSTFSLNVSDASFQTAQAALAKGGTPDPNSIRVEQFYNAVDYGDPAPGTGEPVAATIEQCAHPVIPGRNLVRVALRTGSSGRNAQQPLQLTLLVDLSGSMAREDRRVAMNTALSGLANLLGPNDRITVLGFSLGSRMLADMLPGDQAGNLATLVREAPHEGGTNLEAALRLASEVALPRRQQGAQNRIVLFTDGAANLGNANPAVLADQVKAMRQQGLAFDVAGIGTSELNDRLLGELSRHGNGRFYVMDPQAGENQFASQLAGAFRPAAENVKVQVRFNPQRVGQYKLIGFDEHRLKTEDFRNDQVDAAELAAEEAGVALYQVEVLPNGTGELGEVSVRFRDAAEARMVERTWTIPHTPDAPVFDHATPSLQLAGLAMLNAEKLRRGPLADAIDFNQLATPISNIRQFYPNNRRAAELLEMTHRLK